MIARDSGRTCSCGSFEEELLQVDADESKAEDVVRARAVVTVMGHVRPRQDEPCSTQFRETRVASARPAASRSTSARIT